MLTRVVDAVKRKRTKFSSRKLIDERISEETMLTFHAERLPQEQADGSPPN